MKCLKLFIFVIVLSAIASTAFSQVEDYWGEELYWSSQFNFFRNPVWSPDGQWIAFTIGLGEVYKIPSGGGEPIFVYSNVGELIDRNNDIVINHSFSIRHMAFTPDSNEFTFAKSTVDEERGTIVTITEHEGGAHVSISNLFSLLASVNISSGEVRVHSDGTNPVEGFNPSWSHDGRYITYLSFPEGASSNKITVLDTETSEIWFLDGAPTFGPMFTPDDSEIVFIENDGDLFKIPFEGGEAVQIGSLGSSARLTDISPDGIWVLKKNKDGSVLSAYNIQTEETVTVLNGTEFISFEDAVFSPDGTQICYIKEDDLSFRAGHSNSSTPYIIDFDPTTDPGPAPDPAPVASDYGTRLDFSPSIIPFYYAVSPDEQWIASSTITYPTSVSINIAPAGGGVSSEIFNYPDDDADGISDREIRYLTFSPDSQEIYFTMEYLDINKGSIITANSHTNPLYNVECVNINTGEHRVVVEGASQPSWSNDGRYLVYINFDYMIYIDPSQAVRNGVVAVYDSQTEETRYLTDGEECAWYITDETNEYGNLISTGINYSYPSISPDGSEILCNIYNYDTDERSFCVFPFEGGESEEVMIPSVNRITYPNYSPDGNWIAYTDIDSNRSSRLYLYNRQSSEIIELVDSNCDPRYFSMNFPEFSADGSKIYYSMIDISGEPQIYVLDFDSTTYLKALYVESDTPESFAVMSNFPNPFNPTTTIEFTLPEAGFTQLVIYNIMGQKIRELVSADLPAGVHSVVWDGRDHNGIPASSGVFVSRLTSGVNVVSNRMMLVK